MHRVLQNLHSNPWIWTTLRIWPDFPRHDRHKADRAALGFSCGVCFEALLAYLQAPVPVQGLLTRKSIGPAKPWCTEMLIRCILWHICVHQGLENVWYLIQESTAANLAYFASCGAYGVLCNRLKLSALVILPAVLMLQDVCLYDYYSDIYAARSLASVSSWWHRVPRIRGRDSQNRRRSLA